MQFLYPKATHTPEEKNNILQEKQKSTKQSLESQPILSQHDNNCISFVVFSVFLKSCIYILLETYGKI